MCNRRVLQDVGDREVHLWQRLYIYGQIYALFLTLKCMFRTAFVENCNLYPRKIRRNQQSKQDSRSICHAHNVHTSICTGFPLVASLRFALSVVGSNVNHVDISVFFNGLPLWAPTITYLRLVYASKSMF